MQCVDFYFDFISPYPWLASHQFGEFENARLPSSDLCRFFSPRSWITTRIWGLPRSRLNAATRIRMCNVLTEFAVDLGLSRRRLASQKDSATMK